MSLSRRHTMVLAALSAVLGRTVAAKPRACCPILELRQYTLHPGGRDVLIDLFEREFIEPQEALGMSIVGTFRDLDNPNRFVWLRGFADMDVRKTAFAAFYGGPVWKANRNVANTTMIDSDNVLLLHPVGDGFALDLSKRPPIGATNGGRLVAATIYSFANPATQAFLNLFEREAKPVLKEAGIDVVGSFATEESPNTFPALPVRNDQVFVWFAAFEDAAAHAARLQALQDSPRWKSVTSGLHHDLKSEPETLRLQPTARSALR